MVLEIACRALYYDLMLVHLPSLVFPEPSQARAVRLHPPSIETLL